MRRTSTLCALAVMLVGWRAGLSAAGPGHDALAGWNEYVALVEAGMARAGTASGPFLAVDAAPLAEARQRVRAGELIVAPVEVRGRHGREIDIPDASVHHWRGDVLLAGATVDDVVASLQTRVPPASPDDVLEARVVDRGPGWIAVRLRVQRRKIITVVYDTEHRTTLRTIAPGRATSASVATRIAEIVHPGTPREREASPDEDHGFLWRWRVYWRFEQTPAGVLAECESISLSRPVPALLRPLAGPIIESAARESMEKALGAMRDALSRVR